MKCKAYYLLTFLAIFIGLNGFVQAQSPFSYQDVFGNKTDTATTSQQLNKSIIEQNIIGALSEYTAPANIDFTQADYSNIDLFGECNSVKPKEFLNPNRIPGGGTPWRFLWCAQSEFVPLFRPADWSSITQLFSDPKGILMFISTYNNTSDEHRSTIRSQHRKKHTKVDQGRPFVINTSSGTPLKSENFNDIQTLFGIDWLETEIPNDDQYSNPDERISVLYSRWSVQDYNLKHCLEQPKINNHNFDVKNSKLLKEQIGM